MKNRVQYFIAAAMLAMISISTSVVADPPDPGGPGGGAPPVGAPVGDGVIILGVLAVAYGITRLYAIYKQKAIVE